MKDGRKEILYVKEGSLPASGQLMGSDGGGGGEHVVKPWQAEPAAKAAGLSADPDSSSQVICILVF